MKSIFVFNPESGNGKLKKYKDYILKELSQKYGDVECVETTHAGHARELAQKAPGNYSYFFIAGGDGTVNEIINGFGEQPNKPVIGYIPCGTVNDISRSLGISRNIKKAVKNLITGEVYAHDIFKVNDKYGMYVCCTGLFTKSSYSTKREYKKKMGKIAYFFNGAKDVFTARPVPVTIDYKGNTIHRDCSLVLILNSRSVAGFKLNKRAALNDGAVDVVLVHSDKHEVRVQDIISTLSLFVRGLKKYEISDKVTHLKLSNFTLTTKEGTVINLDGEKSAAGSFKFDVLKQAVQIIVPKKYNSQKYNQF